MNSVDEALTIAQQHHQAGDLPRAEAIYRQILQADPTQPDAVHFLGMIALQVGKTDLGAEYMRQSIALRPNSEVFHCNLGAAYQALGKLHEATASYRAALRLRPDLSWAHNNLGNALADLGQLVEAAACYRQALLCNPNLVETHVNLAVLLQKQGKRAEAAASYQQAVDLKPDYVQAHHALGILAQEQNDFAKALECYRQVLKHDPRHIGALNNLGNALRKLGRLDEAEACFRQVVTLDPNCAEAFNNLGVLLCEGDRLDEAIASFRMAVLLDPRMADAHAGLGVALGDGEGKADEAIACLQEALRLRPNGRLRVALALRLPMIYQSSADLDWWRNRLIREVRQLREQKVAIDLTEEPARPVFFAAYHGLDDRDIQREVARLYRAPQVVDRSHHAPRDAVDRSHHAPRDAVDRSHHAPRDGDSKIPDHHAERDGYDQNRKIKIGFASALFRWHTIGHLMRGLVANLSRADFEVTVLSADIHKDDMAGEFKANADRYLTLPAHLPSARRLIAEQQLDVLFYTDIGMDPITYTLAFSRLAPVQCVTWGHPSTTGIDTIDYFISALDLETDDGQRHYTETLIRPKVLPIYYYRPELPAPLKKRADFGLAEEDHVYTCAQSLFKFHPEFDEVLGGILRGDPKAKLVLSRGKGPHLERLLRRRFAVTLPDVLDRIRFHPPLPRPDFLNLMAVSDVLLDTLHFGGGNTSYEGLAVGTPIVTLPSRFLRGRITFALYKQMNVLDCVASSPREYIDIALRLGTDRGYCEEMRQKILAANGVLFENGEGLRELEQFLRQTSRHQT